MAAARTRREDAAKNAMEALGVGARTASTDNSVGQGRRGRTTGEAAVRRPIKKKKIYE